MKVKSIRLKNYRNYDNAEIKFAETFNIIYGNNAQGKTNIIEAIFYARQADPTVHQKTVNFSNTGENSLRSGSNTPGPTGTNKYKSYTATKKKENLHKRNTVEKIGGLMGHLNAVIFSPEDLLVIKQGPAERRRFIDITLSQLKPSYFYDLQQYAKILFQRNNLLKAIPVNRDLTETLDVWDHHLVKTGSRIMKARKEFIKRLDVLAADRHERLTNCGENLKLVYDPSFSFGDADDEKEIEVAFRDIIRKTGRGNCRKVLQ